MGYNEAIKVDIAGSILAGLLKLFACYYIFDANYPAPYSKVLAICQIFMMEEAFNGKTDKTFAFLIDKIKKQIDHENDLPQDSVDN